MLVHAVWGYHLTIGDEVLADESYCRIVRFPNPPNNIVPKDNSAYPRNKIIEIQHGDGQKGYVLAEEIGAKWVEIS